MRSHPSFLPMPALDGTEARRARLLNEKAARSIWPTGKPARPMSAKEVEACCAKVADARARGCSEKYIATFLDVSHPAYEHDRRTRGIAEGRRLARARRERWLLWLDDADACDDGIAFARRHCSPEAAVWASAESGSAEHWHHVTWLYERLELGWLTSNTCPACNGHRGALVNMARDILDSEEWAAIPWQRDGGA